VAEGEFVAVNGEELVFVDNEELVVVDGGELVVVDDGELVVVPVDDNFPIRINTVARLWQLCLGLDYWTSPVARPRLTGSVLASARQHGRFFLMRQ